jgi:sec-independent protein translocase protein TatA
MHLLVLLIIVLIIFGPGKLPELGGSLGKAIRGFKKAVSDIEDHMRQITDKSESGEKKADER